MEKTEDLISMNEYMRRYGVGYESVKRMIANKELEMKGKKIVIRKNSVPIELYEKVVVENTKLKTIIQNSKKILEEVN